jgi:hypothetical protein
VEGLKDARGLPGHILYPCFREAAHDRVAENLRMSQYSRTSDES